MGDILVTILTPCYNSEKTIEKTLQCIENQTYPNIEQHVSQYHIASYLGIKPESLSRLKSLNIGQ